MMRPDYEWDPPVERAETIEEWRGVAQAAGEDRDTDMAELARLRAIVAAIEALMDVAQRTYVGALSGSVTVASLRTALAAGDNQ